MRAIPQTFRPSSPVPSDDDMSVSSSKNSSRSNNGVEWVLITSIIIKLGQRHTAFWDKNSDSSDDELVKKSSKKSPYNEMIERIHYQRNSTVLISEIGKYVIDIYTPDKFHRLHMLYSVLSTTGLLTLIEGHRTEPIMTEENSHGITTRKIILVPRVEYEDEKSIDSLNSEPILERVVLEEDGAFHYIHDNDRLFSLVYIMFSKTLHHNIFNSQSKIKKWN